MFRMMETPLRIDGRAALKLGDVADHLAGGRTAAGLGDMDFADKRVDDVAGQVCAVGRGDRRALLALEVIVQDELVVVLGQDQVDSRALVIARGTRGGRREQ